MNNLDQRIQAVLNQTPGTGTAVPVSDPSLAEEIVTVFRGRQRWTSAGAMLLSLGFLGLAVWAGLRFYGAPTVREQLLWAGAGLLAVLVMALVKLWFWLELQGNRVLRELKRLELLIISRTSAK